MKHGLAVCFTLLLCSGAQAADPPKPVATPPTVRKPLDLRIGDVRKYMTPEAFQQALSRPDEEKTTVVVEGTRDPDFRLKSEQAIPAGFPPATLWWALRNPGKSWRILAPDVNAPAAGPVYDPVPPPIFRWGP